VQSFSERDGINTREKQENKKNGTNGAGQIIKKKWGKTGQKETDTAFWRQKDVRKNRISQLKYYKGRFLREEGGLGPIHSCLSAVAEQSLVLR